MYKIEAYQCSFCAKIAKNRATIQQHEKKCFHNPTTKSCATCKNLDSNHPFYVVHANECSCSEGVVFPLVGVFIEKQKLQTQCPLWVAIPEDYYEQCEKELNGNR